MWNTCAYWLQLSSFAYLLVCCSNLGNVFSSRQCGADYNIYRILSLSHKHVFSLMENNELVSQFKSYRAVSVVVAACWNTCCRCDDELFTFGCYFCSQYHTAALLSILRRPERAAVRVHLGLHLACGIHLLHCQALRGELLGRILRWLTFI